jgi:hypothetical protein
VCLNKNAFEFDSDIDLSSFWEEGKLTEAIDESFSECEFRNLAGGLQMYGISAKRIDILIQLAQKDAEHKMSEWKERIAESIETALINYDFGVTGVEIKDPHSYYCKEFL